MFQNSYIIIQYITTMAGQVIQIEPMLEIARKLELDDEFCTKLFFLWSEQMTLLISNNKNKTSETEDDKDEASVTKALALQGFMRCPRCNLIAEQAGGCNHMVS